MPTSPEPRSGVRGPGQMCLLWIPDCATQASLRSLRTLGCVRVRESESLSWNAHMLSVESVDLFYGAAQALRSVSLTAEPGQRHLRSRPQRRRQDLAAARHRRPSADPCRQDLFGRGRTSPASRRISAPAAASVMCRRVAKSFRCSVSRKISRPATHRLQAQ